MEGKTIYTVYPRGWFEGRSRGGSGLAKQHAVALEQEPYRGQRGAAFCGVSGDFSVSKFTYREGNAITCARCAKAATKLREAT